MLRAALPFLLAVLAAAQTGPKFEVASIRPVAADSPGGFSRLDSRAAPVEWGPQSFTARRRSLRLLIADAYDAPLSRIVGGPDWAGTAAFDIAAKAAAPASRDDLRAMLRALLADRFHLEVRRETKDTTVFAMVLEKDGPKFQESRDGVDCAECRMRRATPERIATLLSALISLPTRDAAGAIVPHDYPPVVDATGLRGVYDIAFRPEPDADIFAEIARQLGLRLERRRMPLESWIVVSAARPSAE